MKKYVKHFLLVSLIVSFISLHTSIVSGSSSPSIQILSPQNEIYYKVNVTLNFTSEGASTFEYSLDDGDNILVNGSTSFPVDDDGEHTIIVYADGNGTIVSSDKVLFFRCLGDIKVDGQINIRDIAFVARKFGSYCGHPRYDARADLNDDCEIDIRDIAMVARRFGDTCFPNPSPVNVSVNYEDGTPVNASVKVYNSSDDWLASGSTDEDGIYTINLLPGDYYAVATDEYNSTNSSGLFNPNTTSSVTIALLKCTDADGDGYAVEGGDCGLVDCNDTDASIHPGAEEVCNGLDDDCDREVDEGCPTCTDVTIHVQYSDGNPIEGAPVYIYETDFTLVDSGLTDSNGDYKICLESGEYIVRAYLPDGSNYKDISITVPDNTTVTIEFDSGSGSSLDTSTTTTTTTTTTTVACTCTKWKNTFEPCKTGGRWGFGYIYERTCNPSGCDKETRCKTSRFFYESI